MAELGLSERGYRVCVKTPHSSSRIWEAREAHRRSLCHSRTRYEFSKKRSLGFAHLFRPRYPDFLHGAPQTPACAAFIKESRMKFANVSKLHRKSRARWGEPGAPVDCLRGCYDADSVGSTETRLRRSAVPHGTVLLAYLYPGLRPGLLSARPYGTKWESVVLTQTLYAIDAEFRETGIMSNLTRVGTFRAWGRFRLGRWRHRALSPMSYLPRDSRQRISLPALISNTSNLWACTPVQKNRPCSKRFVHEKVLSASVRAATNHGSMPRDLRFPKVPVPSGHEIPRARW
jgi:hypothetical protein